MKGQQFLSVYELFEGHTWYVQAVLNEIYAVSSAGETVDASMVDYALKNVVMSYEPIYQAILSNLTQRQKEVLFAIAQR